MSKKENSNYHMGKHTGYELIDGEYHIAPLYQSQFGLLAAKKQAIKDLVKDLVKMVTKNATQDLEELNKVTQKVWSDLMDDLALDHAKTWTYRDGIVREKTQSQQSPHGE